MKISFQERAKISMSIDAQMYYYKQYHYPCAEAAIDFINRFVMTYDPRKKSDKILPLELFPKQGEYVRWLWNRYRSDDSGNVDKCRTAGATWVTMAFFVYLFLFQKEVSLCVYTYKGDACHKLGDISTLLEKCVFIINHLPASFTGGIKSQQMYITNPNNGSDIAGACGDDPGRGGRRTMVMTDEEAFYQRAELVEAALSETTNSRISVSTHSGTNSLFYRKCQTPMNKFIFDWWDDPRNSQEWFDRKKQEAIDKGILHIFKREIERDAAASVESVIVPSDWVSSSYRNDKKITGKIIAGFDPANEGGDLHGFCVVDGNCIIYAEDSGEGDPGDAIDKYFWKAIELKATEFRYDPIGVGAGAKVRIKEILKTVSEDPNLSLERKAEIKAIKIVAWSASGKIMRPDRKDYSDKPNKELFENAKAQAWWKVRYEFLQTYRYVNDKDCDKEKLIYCKKDQSKYITKLMQELSQPQYKLSASGKTMVDKKPKGTRSPNCFIAETLVLTPNGNVKIETLKKNDLVITPFGYRKIIAIHKSEQDTIENIGLIGTPEHKIFTTKGLKSLNKADEQHIIKASAWRFFIWRIIKKALLNLTGSDIGYYQWENTIVQGMADLKSVVFYCIMQYGKKKTRKEFRVASLSIIKTLTHSIILRTILNVLIRLNIAACICMRDSKTRHIEKKTTNNLNLLGKKLLKRILRCQKKKDLLHQKKGGKRSRQLRQESNEHALYADNFTNACQTAEEKHVVIDVGSGNTKQTDTKHLHFLKNANGVIKNFKRNKVRINSVVQVAPGKTPEKNSSKKQTVYNITVEKDTCYFANMILVKNCADAYILCRAEVAEKWVAWSEV